MTHNKYNIKPGEYALLDEHHKVFVHKFTPYELFAEVSEKEYPKDSWQVMTNRLKPITNDQNPA
jgi:hypothetical protein